MKSALDNAVRTEKVPLYRVGTLSYTQQQLCVLFFWLMWNEFSITLLESVPSLTNVLLKDRGASNTIIAAFGSLGGFFGVWINPVFSTWSDRTRTRYGRRRPFLFFAVPLFTICLVAIPYMPDLYHGLMRFSWAAAILNQSPVNGEVLFICIGKFVEGVFNGIVLALFTYYYWDVVPEAVLGRFNSIAKVLALSAGLVWSFFLFGYAEKHMKEVYTYVSLLCAAFYCLSILMVKEGEYPPPEKQVKVAGLMETMRLYFVDCFCEPFYLWIFVGTFAFQMGNQGVGYQFFYLHYDLGLSLGDIGWSQGWGKTVTAIFGVTLGFAVGTLTDKFKPVRVIPVTFFIWALVSFVSYFVIHDRMTYMISESLIQVIAFINAIAVGAVTVELFPREKMGQFCSAQAMFYQQLIYLLNPTVIAPFFDKIHFNRLGYLWSAVFYGIASIIFIKVYYNWKNRQNAVVISLD